jgi:hypothetical protein
MNFRARLSLFALEARENPSGPTPIDPTGGTTVPQASTDPALVAATPTDPATTTDPAALAAAAASAGAAAGVSGTNVLTQNNTVTNQPLVTGP